MTVALDPGQLHIEIWIEKLKKKQQSCVELNVMEVLC